MDKDLFTILKEFKNIAPDEEYARQSRMFILAHPQNDPATSQTMEGQAKIFRMEFNGLMRISLGVVVMFAAVTALVRGVFYVNTNYSPLALEGLNQSSISSEVEDINKSIQTTLEEINKLDKSNRAAISAINEVAKTADIQVLSSMMSMSAFSAATSTPAQEDTTEDVGLFLIEQPTSTDDVLDSSDAIEAMLDKAAN